MIRLKKYIAILIGVGIGIGIAEVLLYATDWDTKVMWSTLYFVEGDCNYGNAGEIYKRSEDAERLYELNPNSFAYCSNCIHPKETRYDSTFIKVNSLGFRDRERFVKKPDSVYRIIVLGGSNTYGFAVSNEHAYPYIMEDKLNAQSPGRFEVWNAGLSAYVMSQKIAYARQIMESYDPDLLIFQHNNRGRRAFFYKDKEFQKHFVNNKELYQENIPFMLCGWRPFQWLHACIVPYSRFYRLLMIGVNNVVLRVQLRNCETYVEGQLWTCFTDAQQDKIQYYGEYVNDREMETFISEFPDKRFAIFSYDEMYCSYKPPHDNVHYFSFCDRSKEEEYYDMHPPSYVYEWYADQIIGELTEQQFIKLPSTTLEPPQ